MKFTLERNSLLTRLAAIAAIVLFSQQSIAAGTTAGTVVSNTATVDYSVNAVAQTPITSAAATFTVDNRVDFTIVATPNTPVVPTLTTVGDTGVAVEFLLMNTGNQTQDYSFVATNEVNGVTIDGFVDTADMATLTVVVDGKQYTVQGVGDGKDFKKAESDAIKRAAMKLGLGLELWAQESYWLDRAKGWSLDHDTVQ